MSFTNPRDQIYGTVRDSTNLSPFGCLDCLLKEAFEAQTYPLYLFEGTHLCANHVRLRLEQADRDAKDAERSTKALNESILKAQRLLWMGDDSPIKADLLTAYKKGPDVL